MVLYLRISSDRDGDALGVERQRKDCTARAEREGWNLVGEYVDNDKGASSKSSKKRPQYDRMIADAKAGKFDVILSYSNSRLTRRPMEYETLIQLTERHGVKIRTVASGDDDLSTADGRMTARIKASVDAAESETHTPTEVQFYCVDLGGGTLAGANGGEHRTSSELSSSPARPVLPAVHRRARRGAQPPAPCR